MLFRSGHDGHHQTHPRPKHILYNALRTIKDIENTKTGGGVGRVAENVHVEISNSAPCIPFHYIFLAMMNLI